MQMMHCNRWQEDLGKHLTWMDIVNRVVDLKNSQ